MHKLNPKIKIILIIFAIYTQSTLAKPISQKHRQFFEQKIKPILVNNCYECHSAKSEIPQANLWLDRKAGWEKGGDTPGPVIISGSPEKSLLIKAVKHQLSAKRNMPRDNTKLSKSQIELLEQWIKIGAPDPRTEPLPKIKKSFDFKERLKHWAFQKPIKTNPPSVKNKQWPTNEIDNFILSQLEKRNLTPAAPTDKRNLLRRLSYVLTGLPPSPKQVADFQNDKSTNAYEKQVDHLLASPQFGEQWARHWMDLVRYSETKGHEFDYEIKNAYFYRDYLIRSFNQDLPYDQLVKEHIAGDMIKKPRRLANGNNESVLGTGFFRFGDGTHSPVDIQQNALEKMDNMIDVTTRTFNAMTVSCARCHDHKFDAISHEDYYGMYGIMDSSRKTVTAINTSNTANQINDITKARLKLKKQIAKQWLKDIEKIENLPTHKKQPKPTLKPIANFGQAGQQNWFRDGHAYSPSLNENTSFFIKDNKIELRPAAAYSDINAKKIAGSLRSPTMAIPANFITIKTAGKNSNIRIIMENFQIIRNPIYGGLTKNINNPKMSYVTFDIRPWKKLLDPTKGKIIRIYIESHPGTFTDGSISFAQNDDAYIGISEVYAHDKPFNQYKIAKINPTRNVHAAIKRWASSKATPADQQRLIDLLKNNQISQLDKLSNKTQQEIKHLIHLQNKIPKPILASVMTEGNGHNVHLFPRGGYKGIDRSIQKEIPRSYIKAISPIRQKTKRGSGRLQLANDLTNPQNPLTARVITNRLWHHIFGRGIIASVDNFGVLGSKPSHPQLLDHLALDIIKENWSLKKMIRKMVLTSTFKTSTASSVLAMEIDPQKIYLQSMPIRRLQAEAIRDSLLTASGRINLKQFGPSVPIHLTAFMNGRGRPKTNGPLDGASRRSIYTATRRNFLSPFMLSFDTPMPVTTFGKRNTTNVPAQALTLMNDPFVLDQAKHFATDLIKKHKTYELKINAIFQRAYNRPPTTLEKENFIKYITTKEIENKFTQAQANNSHPIWTDLCHIIFNTKEFIYLF